MIFSMCMIVIVFLLWMNLLRKKLQVPSLYKRILLALLAVSTSLCQHRHYYHEDCVLQMYTNPNSIQHCLRFYYLMQGSNIGMLNVYTTAQNQTLSAPIWTLSISQGYQWKQAKVTITIINNFQVGCCVIKVLHFVLQKRRAGRMKDSWIMHHSQA